MSDPKPKLDVSAILKILDAIELLGKLEKSIEKQIKAIGNAKQRKVTAKVNRDKGVDKYVCPKNS